MILCCRPLCSACARGLSSRLFMPETSVPKRAGFFDIKTGFACAHKKSCTDKGSATAFPTRQHRVKLVHMPHSRGSPTGLTERFSGIYSFANCCNLTRTALKQPFAGQVRSLDTAVSRGIGLEQAKESFKREVDTPFQLVLSAAAARVCLTMCSLLLQASHPYSAACKVLHYGQTAATRCLPEHADRHYSTPELQVTRLQAKTLTSNRAENLSPAAALFSSGTAMARLSAHPRNPASSSLYSQVMRAHSCESLLSSAEC